MKRTYAGQADRCRQLRRVLSMLLMLSRRGYTTQQLSRNFGVSVKTVRRDLNLLERVGIPLTSEPFYDDCGNSEQVAGHWCYLHKIMPGWSGKYIRESKKESN